MEKKTIKNSKNIKVTQIKSSIGKNSIQKKHLDSLGLKKIGSSRTIIFNKSTEGLIKKVAHLIKVEENN
ncbi:MAG: 50S ribosomal protein L30 [Pelagibacteraceae bacterium]|nr:50S ribosomal protein L30 [Pelagibacteraceae bacterium]|tara:strand:- start:5923 stop:6129 length:207 start_codon:yes stop_codon:yes gene_type:complete